MPWFLYLPMRGSLAKGWTARNGDVSGWKVSDFTKGLTKFPEGLSSKEGKVGDVFVLVIRITRWNKMHIGSAP